ncbi:MAG: NADH-quinone oxidoreductase subunit H [Lentisphaeria bacterium]|nr:NADH-quinone oxidoreductase subunit H [Lentisphaeria bacterium]
MLNYLIYTAAGLILCPLLPGIINKVKAFFAGRKGPSIFQLYFDIFKLLQKEAVYSSTTGWIFRFAPVVNLCALTGALLLLGGPGCTYMPFSFTGNLILFVYLCGLARLFTVLGAMDTGSSFEGMGASRECEFAIISEGTILAVFCGMLMILQPGSFAIESFWKAGTGTVIWNRYTIELVLFAFAFFLVILTESCRVPVDDPDTHLELTMIHEAMILDNSGPDLAMIHYAAALKMWILFALAGCFFLPFKWSECLSCNLPVLLLFISGGSVIVGIVESVMARFRFKKLPQLLCGGFACALLGVILLILFK